MAKGTTDLKNIILPTHLQKHRYNLKYQYLGD